MLVLLLNGGTGLWAGDLSASLAVAGPGGSATIPVVFTASDPAAALQWTTSYSPAQISGLSLTPGPAAAAAGKTLSCATLVGAVTCVLSGMNTNPVGSGTVAFLTASITPGVTTASLPFSNTLGADAAANVLPVTSAAGGLLVVPTLLPTVCPTATLSPGGTATCTLTLSQAAPAGTTVALASNSQALTVPSSVLFSAGSNIATFTASAAAVIASSQTASVTASYGGSSQAVSFGLMPSVLVSGVVCNPASLSQGALAGCTVTVSQSAPAGGSTIALSSSSSSLSVPAFVTIAAGSTTAGFSIGAAAVIASDQGATITATLGASSQSAAVGLLAPPTLSGLACSPASLNASGVGSCTVSLSRVAPPGGFVVALASGNPLLTAPASVTVPAGAAAASFIVAAAVLIPSAQGATVTASNGGAVQTASINLLSVVFVSSLSCSPAGVMSNGTFTCTVKLSQAVSSDTQVALSVNSAFLSLPAIATVPAGSATVNVTAVAGAIPSDALVMMSATLGSSSQFTRVWLWSTPTLTGLACFPTPFVVGTTAYCRATLSKPSGDVVVAIASGSPTLTVPPTVTVPQGRTTGYFLLTPTQASATPIQLSASYNGTIVFWSVSIVPPALKTSAKTSISGVRPPHGPPGVSSLRCAPQSLAAGGSSTCELLLSAGGPPSAVDVTSSSVQVSVPAEVTTRQDQTSLTFQVQNNSVSRAQRVTVTASVGATQVTDTIQAMASSNPVVRVPRRAMARPGEEIAFTVQAEDASDLPVRLESAGLPRGATFDPATGAFKWMPLKSQIGTYRVSFAATDSTLQSSTADVDLRVGDGLPVFDLPLASCSPGAIATLRGEWLAPSGSKLIDTSGGSVQLGGTSVTVNGAAVPMLYASADRIEFLCPILAAGTPLRVEVSAEAGRSPSFSLTMLEASPEIVREAITFESSADPLGARTFGSTAYPAQPGDRISIFATGLGSPSQILPGNLTIRLGDVYATADSVTPIEGKAGAYVIGLRVPQGVGSGIAGVQLEVTMSSGIRFTSNNLYAAFEAVRP